MEHQNPFARRSTKLEAIQYRSRQGTGYATHFDDSRHLRTTGARRGRSSVSGSSNAAARRTIAAPDAKSPALVRAVALGRAGAKEALEQLDNAVREQQAIVDAA